MWRCPRTDFHLTIQIIYCKIVPSDQICVVLRFTTKKTHQKNPPKQMLLHTTIITQLTGFSFCSASSCSVCLFLSSFRSSLLPFFLSSFTTFSATVACLGVRLCVSVKHLWDRWLLNQIELYDAFGHSRDPKCFRMFKATFWQPRAQTCCSRWVLVRPGFH